MSEPLETEFEPHETLSAKQMKAAFLLASGESYRRISIVLNVSKSTISRWRQQPDFAEQMGTFSAEIMREFQADVLNRLKATPRVLSAIIKKPEARDADRIAAWKELRDTAINWHVVRPLEEARRKMEAGGRDAAD